MNAGGEVKTTRTHSWFSRSLLALDRPFRFTARLTSFGLVSIVVAAVFQYASWRDEKQLTRHREELASAISTFSEISGALSGAMNLQQILYFTHDAITDNSNDANARRYLSLSAKQVFDEYATARIALRKNIDVLIGKADLFIDRPTRLDSERIEPDSGIQVFSNRDLLRGAGFDCDKHLPQTTRLDLSGISIDWAQARYHTATFYYCLERLHYLLLRTRVWAMTQTAAADDSQKNAPERQPEKESQGLQYTKEEMGQIEKEFDLQTRRLNELIALFAKKIEQMRLRSRENGFFRHQFCLECGQ